MAGSHLIGLSIDFSLVLELIKSDRLLRKTVLPLPIIPRSALIMAAPIPFCFRFLAPNYFPPMHSTDSSLSRIIAHQLFFILYLIHIYLHRKWRIVTMTYLIYILCGLVASLQTVPFMSWVPGNGHESPMCVCGCINRVLTRHPEGETKNNSITSSIEKI